MRAKSANFLLPPQNNLHRLRCRPPGDALEEIRPAPLLGSRSNAPQTKNFELDEILGDLSDQAVGAQQAILLLNVSDEIHCGVVASLMRLRDEPIEHHVLSPDSAYFEILLSSIASRPPPQKVDPAPRTIVVSWGTQSERCSLAYDRLLPTLENFLLTANTRLIVTTAAEYCLENLLPVRRTFVFNGSRKESYDDNAALTHWRPAPPSRNVFHAHRRECDAYEPISNVTSQATSLSSNRSLTLGFALASPVPIAVRVGQKTKHFAVQVKSNQTKLGAGELERLLCHTLLRPHILFAPRRHDKATGRICEFVSEVERRQKIGAARGARLLIVGGHVSARRAAASLIAGALPTATHDFSMLLTDAWSPPVGIGLGLILEALNQKYRETRRKICLVVEGLFHSLNEKDAELEFFQKNPGRSYRNATELFDHLALYPNVFHVVALEAQLPCEGEARFASTVDLATLPPLIMAST